MRGVVIDQIEVDCRPGFDGCGHGQMRVTAERDEVTIQGWVIGRGSPPTAVALGDEEGKRMTSVAVDQPRADIAEAFPDIPGACTSGFEVTVRPGGPDAGRIRFLVAFEDGAVSEMACLVPAKEQCELHTSMFVAGVLERERPDVVLSLPTERILTRVPDDDDAFAQLRKLAVGKGGDLPWPN